LAQRRNLASHEMHELHEILGMETTGLSKLESFATTVTDGELREAVNQCIEKKRRHIQEAINILRTSGIS